MYIRWLLAFLHLTALAIGAGGIWSRTVALRVETFDAPAIRRVLRADTFWGVAALLWLATGLLRVFGPYEKGTAYYAHHPLFMAKMATFLIIVALEIRPMLTFIRWRRQLATGEPIDTSTTPVLNRISFWQSHLLVLMILFATAVARGIGF